MIGPGIPNPMLLGGGGDPLDEWYQIARSVRFNSPDTPYFWRQLGAGANRKKGALSVWLNPAKVVVPVISADGNMHVLMAHNGTNVALAGMTAYSRIAFVGDGTSGLNRIQMGSTGSAGEAFVSNDMKRDLAAFGHLYVRWDTTVPMLECYWNGIEISYSSRTLPTLNADSVLGLAASFLMLGAYSSTQARHFDGYVAEPRIFFDSAPPVTELGGFHPRTGQWRPKRYAGSYSAHDSFMDFADGSAATSAALGKDRSGNSNDWTPVNISVAAGTGCDWVLHSPTNVFCTLNPLAWRNGAVQPTYSNGNLDVLNTSGVAEAYSLGTMPLPPGETYFEATILAVSAATPIIGVADTKTMTSVFTNTFGYMVTGQKQINGVNTAYGAAFTTGDVIGVRVNTTVPEIEFYKQTGGAGAFVSQGVIALNAGVEYFPYVNTVLNSKAAFNFGQRAFNNASPPTNAKLLCTKVRPVKPAGPMKSTSAFVAVKDSGANIVATLAAARSAFGSSYIDIIKRSDATAEGWRWIFSDDPTNYIDSSSTAAKAAVPAFGGTAYVGYSLKVSSENGVATGTFVHTNGANSVINDGLSNARKMIVLLRESAGGGTRYVYHPDLTAGKLMYLEQKTAETTDASINTVTASGFTAAAALPSGTYRWISIAETADFARLWKSTGNGTTTDGRFVLVGFAPALDLYKRADVAAPWSAHDSTRSANVNVLELQLNATQGENAVTDPDPAALDLVSNGVKVRTTMTDTNAAYSNANGGIYVGLSIAAFPFRYANAR